MKLVLAICGWAGAVLLAAIFLGSAGGGSVRAAEVPPTGRLLITNVDVRATMSGELLLDRDVLIDGARIADIGRGGTLDPAGAKVVTGAGLVLMPGLVDMHVHFAPERGDEGDAAQRAAAVMLAHGVTTARSMAGAHEHLALREAVESGRIPGPRLYLASPALSDANTPGPDAARAAVRSAKESGFDLVKSHHLTDVETWEAARAEAEKLGIPTAGHISNSVGVLRAANAGQQVEHLDGFIAALLPEAAPERSEEFGQLPPLDILEKADARSRRADALYAELARLNVYQVPTLGLFEKLTATELSAEDLSGRPEMRFIPDNALAHWAAQRRQLLATLSPGQGEELQRLRRDIVSGLGARGVPIMAGSDTAQAFHVWGLALHDEIEVLAEILGPEAALAAATSVPRNYFRSLSGQGSARGWAADFGEVSIGARADLLLVESDPLDNISVLRHPNAVVAGGRYYDREALDRLLDQASAAAKTSSIAGGPIYLMRHLPADETADDPGLIPEGQRFAEVLADRLTSESVQAIFVTDTRRSRETAAPLAKRLGIEPVIYDPRRPDLLLERLKSVGGPSLVVAHSNTAPDLALRMGADETAARLTAEFGQVLILENERILTASLGDELWPAACPTELPRKSRCGRLFVPENRETPGGRVIGIEYAVLPATEAATEDPLVVIPGGPGLGAVQSGAGIAQLLSTFRQNRDILLIDQRGTGGSNRLACDKGKNEGGLLSGLEKMSVAEVRACRDKLAQRADLGQYGTRAAVQDMEALRAALGYDRLDVFGMSYGTRPALDYLRLYPDRTGEVVIRAAAPPAMTLPLHTPRDAQAALGRLLALCSRQEDCAQRYPDLSGDVRRMLAHIEAGPKPISVVDPRTGAQVEAELTAEGLAQVLFFLLYVPEFAAELPPLIAHAANGDYSPMVQTAAPVLVGLLGDVAWGLRWSVICDEDVRRIDSERIADAAEGTFMGRAAIDADVDACSDWPRGRVPADYFEPFRSGKEVLIISGALDPIAGERWGDIVVAALPNARHLVAPSASHLPPLPSCSAKFVREFFDGEPLSSLQTACLETVPPLRLKVGPGAPK